MREIKFAFLEFTGWTGYSFSQLIEFKLMKVSVIQFPGSNCDGDALHAFQGFLGDSAKMLWHKAESLGDTDGVVIPGGFSYGDYLRCGAIARFSPIMRAVKEFADNGGLVLGICNGFQILCEAGLLPGALIRNTCLEFRCLTVDLVVEDSTEYFRRDVIGERIRLPIAHGEGNYRIDPEGLSELEANEQILFRYGPPGGNPNGALNDIAGIRNQAGNVFGMMPHPERAIEPFHPSQDGRGVLTAFIQSKLVFA